ncbi:hypothetical protein FRC07_015157 [Ceratobasidium sp. 392]|nr:hypothetical protein FRC07_015157 [Ceratobasidium sp. 392]
MIAKSFDPKEPYENNQEIADEQARLDKEHNPTTKDNLPPDETDDSGGWSGSECEAEGGDASEADRGNNNQDTGSAKDHATKVKNALNVLEKLHAIVVHATGSPRRLMRKILALIASMPARWNSVLAEIRRAYILKKWVLTLDKGLTGRAQAAARARKRLWTISDTEWDLISLLIDLLEPFERATLLFSKKALSLVFPRSYQLAGLLDNLDQALSRLEREDPNNHFGLKPAILAGREKLIKYINIAQNSQLTVLAMTCHPLLRLTTLSDPFGIGLPSEGARFWSTCMSAEDGLPVVQSENTSSQPTLNASWMDFLYQRTSQERRSPLTEELHDHFSNKYPFKPGTSLLAWWRDHAKYLPVIGRISRDLLCIPAASVSVERLFSQCRLTMTDNRIMAVKTAREILTCQ